jgi:aerobic-type carbon monoxide dehydrogenase small subunit (CoxS/CutS family)
MTAEPEVGLDLTVNKQRHTGTVAGDMPLVHFLHERLGLTGTKIGCSIGECRACTVKVQLDADGPAVTRQSCMTSMRHTSGWHVTTVEGLADADSLNAIQESIVDRQAFQCGYCAAGFAVAGSVALESLQPDDDADKVRERVDAVLGNHICRCTGYSRYRDAILAAVLPAEPRSRNRTLDVVPQMRAVQRLTESDIEKLGYTPIFDDPILELIRLLRDGAEIEHSLLVQYLYATFSIKLPEYVRLAGWPNHRYGGRPLHMMGVAIEEMVHLDIVNELLVDLGAAPHLGRQQFPYEQDIYPFDFELEPLSLHSIAKYVYVEASSTAVDLDQQTTPEDRAFVQRLYDALGVAGKNDVRPNQVGSFYRKVSRVLELLREHQPDLIDYDHWEQRLAVVRDEGEIEHFELFRSLFDGTHPALPGDPGIWNTAHPQHPVTALRHETGLPRSGEPVVDEPVPAMRHMANLHYWAVCMLLDLSYRSRGQFHSAARRHMAGPLRSLGSALAAVGEGLPFDVFVASYAPGLDTGRNHALTGAMLQQVVIAQDRYARHLPHDYSHACAVETIWELTQLS